MNIVRLFISHNIFYYSNDDKIAEALLLFVTEHPVKLNIEHLEARDILKTGACAIRNVRR